MSTHKERNKDLKSPDLLQVKGGEALSWAAQNRQLIILVTVPVLLLVLGIAGFKFWSDQQSIDRSDALGKIDIVYQKEEQAAEDQREKLRKEKNALTPAEPPKDGKAAAAPEVEQKKKDLDAKIEAVKANHSGSLAQYRGYFEEHRDSAEGWVAGLTASRILTDNKQFKEAADLTRKVLTAAKKDEFFSAQANFLLAGILEEVRDFDGVIASIEALQTFELGDDMKPRLLLWKARVFALKDAKAEALASAEQLLTTYSDSREVQQARALKALLQ